jgi:hypothetical protein
MNIDIEVNLKIRASEKTPQVETPRPVIRCLLAKLASHPCIVMLLRELIRQS